jgi:hypothetical protein
MSRSYWISFVVPCLATLVLAQPVRPTLRELEFNIQAELEAHGERVLGQEAYRWSTRLENISNCRAELTVQVTSNVGGNTVRTDRVRFSLGALEPYGIMEKNWLELPCAGREECIFSSSSTCTKKTTEGVAIDCTTVSRKREDSFVLQLDGDAAASSRLEHGFRQAIELCHDPAAVTF